MDKLNKLQHTQMIGFEFMYFILLSMEGLNTSTVDTK